MRNCTGNEQAVDFSQKFAKINRTFLGENDDKFIYPLYV
ncbi:hypothetical protein X781_6180 [Mannheimia sp. USDA-ARS-USMARC-1261]|nr:hypothetical protein X781_6180 [Mannheimia sp. USDA-ARS-USMARC-1261]